MLTPCRSRCCLDRALNPPQRSIRGLLNLRSGVALDRESAFPQRLGATERHGSSFVGVA